MYAYVGQLFYQCWCSRGNIKQHIDAIVDSWCSDDDSVVKINPRPVLSKNQITRYYNIVQTYYLILNLKVGQINMFSYFNFLKIIKKLKIPEKIALPAYSNSLRITYKLENIILKRC